MQGKPIGKEAGKVARASVKFEHFFAFRAEEMVMVVFARDLITGRFPWYFHHFEPALLQQLIDRSVDRRNAECRHLPCCPCERLVGL